MLLSTDITLPRDHPAKFPDHCVICNVEAPDATFAVGTGDFSRGAVLVGLPWFGRSLIHAPACRSCALIVKA